MDLHRLAEERSIAMHAVLAERLRADREIVARARARFASQRGASPRRTPRRG